MNRACQCNIEIYKDRVPFEKAKVGSENRRLNNSSAILKMLFWSGDDKSWDAEQEVRKTC